MNDAACGWALEIRAFLLGRLGKTREADSIRRMSVDFPTCRIRDWWILEGKRYAGLDASLAGSMDRVHRLAKALLGTYNPRWLASPVPHGEVDWIATAQRSTWSSSIEYVTRASSAGLTGEEREALLGWISWVRAATMGYHAAIGVAAPALPDWAHEHAGAHDPTTLRWWARVARRSRWPLLRNVVAESLRPLFEPQELDRLPLPGDREDLFEIMCLVRLVKVLDPDVAVVRWLDLDVDANSVCTPRLVARYQKHMAPPMTLRAGLYPAATVLAMEAQGLNPPSQADLVIELVPPRAGFHALLIECKSGLQPPERSIYQLLAYRSALRSRLPGRMLVWGIVERPMPAPTAAQFGVEGDAWVFSSADEIASVLALAGLTGSASG